MTSTGDNDSETDSFPDYDITSDDALSNENAYIKRSDSDVEENGSDFSDGSLNRENRYTGSSNTWRYFTREERALAASLDQQQANDLSLHLYCAYALKASIRDADPRTSHSRRRSSETGNDDLNWCPDATWTAWPVKPQHLPKPDEHFGAPRSGSDHKDDNGTIFQEDESRSTRDEFEQEILALMLKRATSKLRARATGQAEQMTGTDLLLDDEEAGEALRSDIEKIRSQVDNLLLRLPRETQRRVEGGKRARSGSSRSRSISRASVQAISNSRRRAPISSEFIADSDSDTSDDATSKERQCDNNDPSSTDQANKRRPKHLKTWTELLRAAAHVGFDHAAVQRAADRCALLFGETITVPVLYDCPITTCKRHGVPYEKGYQWREHLCRTHKYAYEDIYKLEASSNSTNTTKPALMGGARSLVILGSDESAWEPM